MRARRSLAHTTRVTHREVPARGGSGAPPPSSKPSSFTKPPRQAASSRAVRGEGKRSPTGAMVKSANPSRRPHTKGRDFLRRHRLPLRFAARVTVAAVLALALAQLARMPLPLWAVLTAVIVTQISVGKSLRATVDYVLGTIGGAVYGGALSVLIPHSSDAALLALLAASVAPLALLAAMRPNLTAAPITAIIVLLVPTFTHTTALASALDRVLEVALGGTTGFVVSLLLLPAPAYGLVIDAGARTLQTMAETVRALLRGLSRGLDTDALHHLQDAIGQLIAGLDVVSREVASERAVRIVAVPDPGPLLRTLMRLRHDLVMIGRAALRPLAQPLAARLEASLAEVAETSSEYLADCGATLRARRKPPPRTALEAALGAFAAQLAALRREGATRSLPAEDVESLFALGFALEQLGNDCRDLERCVAEWSSGTAAR